MGSGPYSGWLWSRYGLATGENAQREVLFPANWEAPLGIDALGQTWLDKLCVPPRPPSTQSRVRKHGSLSSWVIFSVQSARAFSARFLYDCKWKVF